MNITQEKKLLLLCTNINLNNADLNEINQVIKHDLDWKQIPSEARKQGVAPFVYYNLSQIPESNFIPATYLSDLKQDYVKTMGRNIAIFEELKFLLTILDEAEIEVVVLKGPALIETVYQNLAFRFMCDIDILVRKNDLARAQDCLLRHGYIQERQIPVNQLTKFHHHLTGFRRHKKSPRIEIHWTIGSNYHIFNIDIDEIWRRVKKCKIAAMDTLILSPEDTILHLCFHLCISHIFPLTFIRLYDIAAAIRRYQDSIDWNKIIAYSVDYKIVAPVYAGLSLVQDFFRINMLSAVLTQLHSKCSKSQLVWVEMIKENSTHNKKIVSNLLFWNNSFCGKFKYLFSKFFPSVTFLSIRYRLPRNSKRVYIYYIIRPPILLINYGISIAKLVASFTGKYIQNILNPKSQERHH